MKKLMIALCVIILVLTGLGCSSESKKDFRDVSWGTKLDKVISMEKKNGNAGYEEEIHDEHEKSIEYSNLIVLGKKADATYVFIDLLDNDSIMGLMEESKILFEELDNPNTTEARKDEIRKLMDQRMEEMQNAADEYPLDDFLLHEASYDFGMLSSKDSDELLAELTSKYGDPKSETYANSLVYLWENDRSTIKYSPERYSTIDYTAKYSIMEQFADVDKYNKKSNSKESKDEL
ncbi:hypothetical protein [Paenibacillus sp. MER 99-2]|uniref:hypothetical protein n=1 Tax=Paenibacillus sp. MER 99-2 TaxID=2939572 RepID=UPI00203B2884|nr:hypothetical protein [Paenibacillus sp. MER 99-2]MCM3173446.1 hypothetical protein [Paenibacillus sp. MER 99-2]